MKYSRVRFTETRFGRMAAQPVAQHVTASVARFGRRDWGEMADEDNQQKEKRANQPIFFFWQYTHCFIASTDGTASGRGSHTERRPIWT
jgi:hypothetical protein